MKTKKAKPQPTPKSTPPIVIISNGDDWEGIYVNGKLRREDYRLSTMAALESVGFNPVKRYVSCEYLGDTVSSLPEKLADIPVHAFQD